MIKPLFIIALLICSFTTIEAQELFLKRDGLDLGKVRYEKMKNAPYLFEKFTQVKLTNKFGKVIEGLAVNYNGYTGELETEVGDKIVALDAFSYPKFEVISTGDIYINAYVKNGSYLKLIFDGEKTRYLTQFFAHLDEKGNKFNGEVKSYIIKEGKVKTLSTEMDIIATINDPKLKAYAEENKLKGDNTQAITKLLSFYENN